MHRHRDARRDRRLARGDLALARLEDLAHQDLVDVLGGDAGALERRGDGKPAELHRGEAGRAQPESLPMGVRAPATMTDVGTANLLASVQAT